MKRTTLRFLALGIVFLVLLALLLGRVSFVLNDKFSYKYDGEYYQSAEEYDVLFLGSSHIMNSIYPLEMFQAQGITAYNLGMTNESLATSYWRLREALEHHTPRVVVMDSTLVSYNMAVDPSDPRALAFLHNSLDVMPLGLTKVQALADLFGWRDVENIANYLFPLAAYHSRWSSLTEDDFHPWLQADRGALPIRSLYQLDGPLAEVPVSSKAPLPPVGADYLNRILTLCQERDLPLVLLAVPYCADETSRQILHSLPDAAAGYDNVRCINLFDEGDFDWRTDFSDAVGHLNTASAARLSRRLAGELAESYALPDHRGEPAAAKWEEDYRISTGQHLNKLLSCGDLNTALMLADHSGLSCQVRLTGAALEHEQTALLAARLTESPAPPDGSPALPEDGCALLVWPADSSEPAQLLQF